MPDPTPDPLLPPLYQRTRGLWSWLALASALAALPACPSGPPDSPRALLKHTQDAVRDQSWDAVVRCLAPAAVKKLEADWTRVRPTIDDPAQRPVRDALANRIALPGDRLAQLSTQDLVRAWVEATAGREGTALHALPGARLVNVSTSGDGRADLNLVFDGTAARNVATVRVGQAWYFERAFGLADLLDGLP